MLFATFLANPLDLFGLRQVYLSGKAYTPVMFREILLYRWIRHPMMLGLLIGIHYEEIGLQADLGDSYRQYKRRTTRLLPFY